METPASDKSSGTFLIVEDQDAMRASLRDFLQTAYPDFNIAEAENGNRCLRSCRQTRPALVLMDVRLPDANGIDLTLMVKAMLPETAVIIVSGLRGSAYTERAFRNGASAYIAKHRVYHELLPAISRALGIQPLDQRHRNTEPGREQQ